MMERLIKGYSHGYTQALMRVKDTLNQGLAMDMKNHNIRMNTKSLQAIIDCMIKNREVLRENPWAFVRCNNKVKGGFEVYVPKGFTGIKAE